MGLINWVCLIAAYVVAVAVERGNLAAAAGYLLPAALIPGLLLWRARPARPAYHAWTLAVTLVAAFGGYYLRAH